MAKSTADQLNLVLSGLILLTSNNIGAGGAGLAQVGAPPIPPELVVSAPPLAEGEGDGDGDNETEGLGEISGLGKGEGEGKKLGEGEGLG